MPFDPQLQASVDRVKARMAEAPVEAGRAAELRKKIEAREGQSGYASNVAELKAELAKEEAHGDD